MNNIVSDFIDALLSIDRIRCAEILESCYPNDNKNFPIIEEIISESLKIIGEDWNRGMVSLAQVYMSGVLCEELIDFYLPKVDIKRKLHPRIAIGVLLDHHALGKKIVSSIIRANGYDLIDFGQGLQVEEIVKLSIKNNIDILLISTLMLPSALKVKIVKEKLIKNNSFIKIVAGGAPFRLDKNLWKNVKVDAYGRFASDIINILKKYID